MACLPASRAEPRLTNSGLVARPSHRRVSSPALQPTSGVSSPTLPPALNGRGQPFDTIIVSGRKVLIDAADAAIVASHSWWISDHGYVIGQRRGKGQRRSRIRLHRLLVQPPAGLEIDHVNGDKLDNRRKNLRIVGHGANIANRDYPSQIGFRGVHQDKCRFKARVSMGGVLKSLGSFTTAEEAAAAYDRAAISLYGNFARLNFPRSAVCQGRDPSLVSLTPNPSVREVALPGARPLVGGC